MKYRIATKPAFIAIATMLIAGIAEPVFAHGPSSPGLISKILLQQKACQDLWNRYYEEQGAITYLTTGHFDNMMDIVAQMRILGCESSLRALGYITPDGRYIGHLNN